MAAALKNRFTACLTRISAQISPIIAMEEAREFIDRVKMVVNFHLLLYHTDGSNIRNIIFRSEQRICRVKNQRSRCLEQLQRPIMRKRRDGSKGYRV